MPELAVGDLLTDPGLGRAYRVLQAEFGWVRYEEWTRGLPGSRERLGCADEFLAALARGELRRVPRQEER